MKAIHNDIENQEKVIKVGNYKLKYNFESNSQLIPITKQNQIGWEL